MYLLSKKLLLSLIILMLVFSVSLPVALVQAGVLKSQVQTSTHSLAVLSASQDNMYGNSGSSNTYKYLNEEFDSCTTIVVGKKASADGSVLVAHNEDDSGKVVIRLHVVRRNEHPGAYRLTNGTLVYKEPHTMLTIPVPESSYAYIWSEMPGMDFSDSYINEYGVVIMSDWAASREDKPSLVNGGIRYYLRRLAIEQARTAREAVEIMGALIEKYGYGHPGRVYIVADPNEAWIVQVVYGKHWLAQRVPDDAVVVVPNKYVSRQVNLSDTENFLGSKDLIEYAIERGWYDPERDGVFDFTKVYGRPDVISASWNVYRQQMGLYLLTGKIYPIHDLPFAAKPDHKITIEELMSVMRSVSTLVTEQTKYGNAIKGSFHRNLPVRPISVWTTQESFVIQLRSWLPPIIGVVYWRAPGIPDINVYIPIYLGMIYSDFPEPYKYADPDHIDMKSAYWAFRVFTNFVDLDYPNKIDMIKSYQNRTESEFFKLQPYVEETALKIYNELGPEAAGKYLADYSSGVLMRVYTEILEMVRSWQSGR